MALAGLGAAAAMAKKKSAQTPPTRPVQQGVESTFHPEPLAGPDLGLSAEQQAALAAAAKQGGGGDLLTDLPTLARDNAILNAIFAGWYRIEWAPLELGRDGHTLTVFVSKDALRVSMTLHTGPEGPNTAARIVEPGTPGAVWVRVNLTHPNAEIAAHAIEGSLLNTTRTSDQSYMQADVKLQPIVGTGVGLPPDSKMGNTSRMLRHSLITDKMIGVDDGSALVRPVGKDYINSLFNRAKQSSHACIYGLQSPDAPARGKSDHNLPPTPHTIQMRSTIHGLSFEDYSQTVQLVRRECILDGQHRDVGELYTDPVLYRLVSDEEGPLPTIRHPAAIASAPPSV